jgi:hypothetical protein
MSASVIPQVELLLLTWEADPAHRAEIEREIDDEIRKGEAPEEGVA